MTSIEEKYRCPLCGFESNGSGLCPVDDEPLKKICLCGSGSYATECCETDSEETDLALAEAKADEMEDLIKGAEIVEDEDPTQSVSDDEEE